MKGTNVQQVQTRPSTYYSNYYGDCPYCTWHFQLSQSHHDWLISTLERGGIAELYHLIEMLDGDADEPENREDGVLAWPDLPGFVARHNWSHPGEVVDFAHFIENSIRRRIDKTRFPELTVAS
jgi:hypothetical protein